MESAPIEPGWGAGVRFWAGFINVDGVKHLFYTGV
jgi:hypothetical protein